MHRRLMLILGLALAAPVALSAPRYVNSPPLSASLAKTPIAAVPAGTVQVPLITWGGDIATIVANGNQPATAAGSPFAKEGLDLRLVREDVFSKQIEAYMSGRSPYLRGTLGMVNMEAMSSGVPVLVPADACIAEFVTDGLSAECYEFGATGLSRAIARILDDPRHAQLLSANGRRAMIERWKEVPFSRIWNSFTQNA